MIIMMITVQICDEHDPHANTVVDGVYRATSRKLQELRANTKVKINGTPSKAITLGDGDYKLIEERIINRDAAGPA